MTKPRRLIPLISAGSIALTVLTGFGGITACAAEKVTKTFTAEETAALYGYNAIGELTTDDNILIWCADSSGGYTSTMHPQSMVYSSVTVNDAEYIAVRVYMWRDAIVARRDVPAINVQASYYITLPLMYDFHVGGGCITGNTTADTSNDLLYVKFYDNSELVSDNSYFGQHYTIYSGLWNSGSATNVAVKTYSPRAATAPVYQMYVSETTGYTNFQLKLTAPGYVTLDNASVTDYGDCYAYVLYRCPTIVVDSDALEDINSKLDVITQDMGSISESLIDISDSLLNQSSEDIEAIQTRMTRLTRSIPI